MAQQVIEHTVTTTAAPQAVYSLLADGSTWPTWSPVGAFTLVEPGDGVPEGVGAVRVFTTGRIKSREQVVRAEPNQLFSYILISGLAIRDYTAVITLTPTDAGTSIHWRSTFRAKVPGTGGTYQRQLGKFIGETVKGLAAAASRSVEA